MHGVKMNIAVVTGASSGIGKEFVIQIAENYHKLDEIWVIARRKERLNALSNILHTKIKVLTLDLTLDTDLKVLETELAASRPTVRILANCAGYGKTGSFVSGTYQEETGMIDVNCKALTAVTYLILPYMKAYGRIIQIASAASFLPQPGFAVYAASKSYVLSFSRALNQELRHRKIQVTAVCPGPVDTEFFAISDPEDRGQQYKKIFRVKQQKVVKKALKDAALGNEISIYGWPMKLVFILAKIIPHKFIIKIVYKKDFNQ